MSEQSIIQSNGEQWAVLELMGHGQTAGRIEKPAEWGGLIRVDVPQNENGDYATEFYGISSIYRIKFVSEEIARAFAPSDQLIEAYDTPIVTREQHHASLRDRDDKIYDLRNKVDELERRLIAVKAIESGE